MGLQFYLRGLITRIVFNFIAERYDGPNTGLKRGVGMGGGTSSSLCKVKKSLYKLNRKIFIIL